MKKRKNDRGAGLAFLLGAHAFKQIALPTTWEHLQTKTKMLSIAIILPSRIGQGQGQISVKNGGHVLELTVQWTAVLLDMNVLLADKLRDSSAFSTFHPM